MEPTKYYKLWFDDTDDQAVICRDYDLKGVSRYVLSQAQPIKDWPQDVTFYAEGKYAEDYLGNARGWPLVSERVRFALEQLEIEGIQFLPVRIVRSKAGEQLSGYSVMNVLSVLAALDREHSDYQEHSDGLIIFKVALRQDIARQADIFRLKERMVSIFISSRIKECLESIRASGFKFIPVKAY